jgi:hypothetical protein
MNRLRILLLFLLPMAATAQGHHHIEGTGEICFCEPISLPKVITDSTIFMAVPVAAEFSEGTQAMITFIEAHKDPSKTYREDSPKAYLKFIVEKDGRLTNIQPIRNCSCNPEAERILKQMPPWKPAALKDGKIVRSYFVLKIEFK